MRKRMRMLAGVSVCGVIAAGAAGCGSLLFAPLEIASAVSGPSEQLVPIGADEAKLYVARTSFPNYGAASLLAILFPPVQAFAPVIPNTYDVQAVDFVTGERTTIEGGLPQVTGEAAPYIYDSSLALTDGRWVVSATETGGLQVFDVASGATQAVLDGVLANSNASLAAIGDGQAVIVSADFLVVVDLASGQAVQFGASDLHMMPEAAAIEGTKVAVLGMPIFSGNPAFPFNGGGEELYLVDLADGSVRPLADASRYDFTSAGLANLRFRDGRIYWWDGNANVISVISADATTNDSQVFFDLNALGNDANVRDFGPEGVMYARMVYVGPSIFPAFVDGFIYFGQIPIERISVNLATPDGQTRELRSKVSLPLFEIPMCKAIFGTPAAGASFGRRLVSAVDDPCVADVYDAAGDGYRAVMAE